MALDWPLPNGSCRKVAEVFIFAIKQEVLDEADKLIGGKVTTIQADAANRADLDRVADILRKVAGKVDIVVSNAGFTQQVMPL